MAGAGAPPSIAVTINDGNASTTSLINRIINNTPTTTGGKKAGGAGSSAPTSRSSSMHEYTPLLQRDPEERRRKRRKVVSVIVQVFGAAVLAGSLLVGVIFYKRSGHDETVPPFPDVTHPLQPTAFWGDIKGPYPTGAWWLNLVIGDGDQNVAVLPYAVKATDARGLEVSYSAHRHLSTSLVVADLWAPDFRMAAEENATSHYVEAYDALSVSLAFKISDQRHGILRRPTLYRTHLVRGCPYITVEYYRCTPVIEPPNMVTIVNGLLFKMDPEFEPPTMTNSIFDITAISGQRWMLFASPPITLRWTRDHGLHSVGEYTGFLRLALAPTDEARQRLAEHWRAYPTGGEVILDYEQDDMITYQWRKKGSGPLLMLALPHHVGILQGAEVVDELNGVYHTMKGHMTAVVGDHWFLKENVPDIRWNAPRPILPGKEEVIRRAIRSDLKQIQQEKDTVANATNREDGKWKWTDPNDPYWHGKQLAMLGRIALIADELGMKEESHTAVQLAQDALEPWLLGTNTNAMMYDTTWGGVVIKNGLKDPYVDFGNTYYNDHHFQYGYFAYAAAVIAKLDPAYLKRDKHQSKINALVRDIANYEASNRFFPLARHKDFFDGHSWASGLFVQNNGKSQESSSEAINAYYAASLYGEATGDWRLQRFARLLMAMEIRSTQFYWHMPNSTSVYDPEFSANKMVGVVGALDAAIQTWFGGQFEFVHAINFMPFTPITEAYLDEPYVAEEYPVLSTIFTRSGSPPTEEWKGFVYLGHAVIDRDAAWEEVQTLKHFDSGNSLTNSLYWVATRPDSAVFRNHSHEYSGNGTHMSSIDTHLEGGLSEGEDEGGILVDTHTDGEPDNTPGGAPVDASSTSQQEGLSASTSVNVRHTHARTPVYTPSDATPQFSSDGEGAWRIPSTTIFPVSPHSSSVSGGGGVLPLTRPSEHAAHLLKASGGHSSESHNDRGVSPNDSHPSEDFSQSRPGDTEAERERGGEGDGTRTRSGSPVERREGVRGRMEVDVAHVRETHKSVMLSEARARRDRGADGSR